MKEKKPLLLIFPFELLSHYLRCLEIAKPLSAYFNIKIAHSPGFSAFIEDAGFETFPYDHIDSGTVMECARNFDFAWISEDVLLPLFEQQVKCIKAIAPKVVLGDFSPTLKMAAERTGVKHLCLINGYMSRYYAFVRGLSRRHPAYHYREKIPEKIFDGITAFAETLSFRKVHTPFKKIRSAYGLKKVSNYLGEFEGDLTWICDLEPLFPQKKLPESFSFISPLFHKSGLASEYLVKELDRRKKTILVTMGSTGTWEHVSFLNKEYYSIFNVIAVGDAGCVLNARHITHASFVNADALFPFVDLVICHGGNGTIYQALAHGLPVLSKTTHFEQEWNMQAVERLGLGKNLDDVHHSEDYEETVAAWVEMKKEERFMKIQQRIQDDLKRLPQMVHQATSCLLS